MLIWLINQVIIQSTNFQRVKNGHYFFSEQQIPTYKKLESTKVY